ncbi:MAG: hypothetical protein WCE23_03460 [Candidatus Binatus sp.]
MSALFRLDGEIGTSVGAIDSVAKGNKLCVQRIQQQAGVGVEELEIENDD